MGSKWRESTWGDEVTLEYGKAKRDYKDSLGDVRVYGSNGAVGWTDMPLHDGPGVILGRKGAYRGVEYSDGPFFVIDTAYFVVPKTDLDARWLYYAVKHHKLGEIDDGSPVPSTTRAAVYVRPVEIPPLPEQRAIAEVLGSLDDRIELNRRMNRTLESMARALFQSRFVDDPDPAWELKPASEVLQINPKRTIKKSSVAPYLDMKNVPSDSHLAADVIDREFKSGSKFINGDTLLARITPCLENGKTAFVDFLDESVTGWGSTEFIVLRPVEPLPVEYAYYLARSDAFRGHAIQSMTGTSGRQRVPHACFDQLLIPVPSHEAAEAFGSQVRLLMERIRHNDDQSRTLAALRDALLPRLLSGELSVEEVTA